MKSAVCELYCIEGGHYDVRALRSLLSFPILSNLHLLPTPFYNNKVGFLVYMGSCAALMTFQSFTKVSFIFLLLLSVVRSCPLPCCPALIITVLYTAARCHAVPPRPNPPPLQLIVFKQMRAQNKDKKITYFDAKYYNKDSVLALAGDRGFGNAHEQAIFFIPLYWLHAALVDDRSSLLPLACAYGGTRMLYPVAALMNTERSMKRFKLVFFATVPGYGVLGYLTWGLYKYAMDY